MLAKEYGGQATPGAAGAAAGGGAESGACGQATLSRTTAAPQSTAAAVAGDGASMLLAGCSVFFSLDPTDVGSVRCASVCVGVRPSHAGEAWRCSAGELERRAVQNSNYKLWVCILEAFLCRCSSFAKLCGCIHGRSRITMGLQRAYNN